MNSYNYNNNNNNRNQMPTNNNGFFVDFLQGMYNNNNNGNNPWNNNGYDDNYYNDNYNQINTENTNYNNYNNNNDNYTKRLSAFEFRKYQRLLNAGLPRHVALSKAKFNPTAKRKISESKFQIPPKKPNITVHLKNTAKSTAPVSKARPSASYKQNTSTETKKNVSSTSAQKAKAATITTSSTPKSSNNNVKEKSAEQAKKNNASNSKQNSQKPKAAVDSETNSAKNNDKRATTESSNKNKSSKQSSTSASTANTANETSSSTTRTTTTNLNKENSSSSHSNNRNINSSKNGSSISNNKTTTKTPSTTGAISKTNENTTSASQEQESNDNKNNNKDKTIRIGIMAKGFPNVVLDQNELEQLEEAIVQAMSEGWTSKLIFDGIIYRPGVLLIDCSNHKTASWLTLSIQNLANWRGADLEARFGYNMPDVKFITIYLPKAADRDDEFLLRLLAAQNEGLYVKLWTICCSIAQGQGKLMTIGVDDMSFDNIMKCDFLLRYRFGKIMVHTQTPGNIVSDPVADESAANHSMSEDFELDEEDLNGIEECFFTVKTEKPD